MNKLTFRNKVIYTRYWIVIITTESINIEESSFFLTSVSYLHPRGKLWPLNYQRRYTIYFTVYLDAKNELNSLP